MSELLAPNGKPSNLTPEQYKLVRKPEFKAWFGDWEKDPANASKVVDENGEPMQMYHKTDNNKFTIFDKEKLGDSSGWETAYLGFYFGNKYEKGSYGKKTIKCFLNIKNPFLIKTEYYADFDREYKRKSEPLLMDDFFNKNKYDGILIDVEKLQKYETMDKVFVAFEPNQIKLSDGTNTTFDSSNPDIRFDDGGSVLLSPNGKPSRLTAKQYKLVHSDDFKQWYGDWENDRENSGIINGYTKEPIVFYHSTKSDFLSKKGENIFKNPPFFFSFKKDVSEYIVRIQHQNKKGRVYTKPFFLKFHKTFDLSQVKILKDEELTRLIKKHTFYQTESDIELLQLKLSLSKFRGNTWFLTENEDFQDYIKNKGYDSFVIYEEGDKNIAVFEPNQIKLADGVNKTFDGSNPDVRFAVGGEVNIQASVDFDKKYGTSISKTDWTYPNGYTTDEVFEKILMPISSSNRPSKKKWKVFEDYVDNFNKSNFNYPHLENLWEEDLWWVLWGMVSGYNYDDIVYFITKWKTDFNTERPKQDENKKELIRLGVNEHDMQWVFSPKTFNKIKKQLTKKFNNGGETDLDNIELDFYVVRFDTDDNSEIELVTNDFEDAKYRYDSTSIGDYGEGSFSVSLEKFTNKYKLVYELDEDETIEDYPIEDYHEDSYYYELIDEGEHEVIENRFIESVNNSSNDLLNDLENWAKNKFGNYKYNRIDVYSEDDENEENDSIGSIQLRIADHSQNENNLPYGVDRSLSVVIANKDATRGRFQQNKPQIYFNGDDSFDYVTNEIENYIEILKDDIRSDYKLGGEVGTGLFSQIWNWFGIKF